MWIQEVKGTGRGRGWGKGKGICESKGNIKLKLPLHIPWKHNGGADRELQTF